MNNNTITIKQVTLSKRRCPACGDRLLTRNVWDHVCRGCRRGYTTAHLANTYRNKS